MEKAPEQFRKTVMMILLAGFAGYTFYLYAFPPVQAKLKPDIDHGKMVWQLYNCGSCHQFYGLGGYLGPDLTNVYSRRGEQYIRAMIQAGPLSMPSFRLNETEMNNLMAFLKNVDQSGVSDPRSFQIRYDGTFEQK